MFSQGQMNEALNPTPDDSDTEAILIVEGQEAVTLTKLQVINIHIIKYLLYTYICIFSKLYIIYKKMKILSYQTQTLHYKNSMNVG